MKARYLPLLASLAAFVPLASAQTALTIPNTPPNGTPCSPTLVYCYSVPLSDGNSVWIDIAPYSDPISSRFLAFHSGPWEGTAYVNLDSTYKVTTQQITLNGHVYTVPSEITFTFAGSTTSGENYTGVGAIALGNWYVAQGRYGGLRYYITGGQIVFNAPQGTSKVETAPKFEPASFHLKTRPLFKDLIPCCTFPPEAYNCQATQDVTGWWQCGPPGVTCAVYKAYCEVSGEGGYYQWIYFTWYT